MRGNLREINDRKVKKRENAVLGKQVKVGAVSTVRTMRYDLLNQSFLKYINSRFPLGGSGCSCVLRVASKLVKRQDDFQSRSAPDQVKGMIDVFKVNHV